MTSSITAMLHVADVEESRRFYQALGFGVVRTNLDFGDDSRDSDDPGEPDWMLLELDGARVMLNAGGHRDAARRDVTLDISVADADAAFAKLPAGTTVVFAPRDQFYGRRDFEIRDPSGFSLLFGQDKR